MIWTDAQDPSRADGAAALPRRARLHHRQGLGLTCFELKTGKKLWDDDNQLTPTGRNPHASIVWLNDGDRALALNSVGELVLCRLNPKGYEEQSRAKVLNGSVWGHPAFAGRFLFAKTDGAEAWRKAGQCELVCVELAGEVSEPRSSSRGSCSDFSSSGSTVLHPTSSLHRPSPSPSPFAVS